MLTFPFTSVTVKITVLLPRLVQLKVLGATVTVAIPQLSNDPLLICAAVIVACPAVFKFIVNGCVITVGRILSCTVTVALAEVTFPFTSVTVKITVFAPTLAQVKEVLFKVIVLIAQLSVEPLLIIAGVMVAWPLAFN